MLPSRTVSTPASPVQMATFWTLVCIVISNVSCLELLSSKDLYLDMFLSNYNALVKGNNAGSLQLMDYGFSNQNLAPKEIIQWELSHGVLTGMVNIKRISAIKGQRNRRTVYIIPAQGSIVIKYDMCLFKVDPDINNDLNRIQRPRINGPSIFRDPYIDHSHTNMHYMDISNMNMHNPNVNPNNHYALSTHMDSDYMNQPDTHYVDMENTFMDSHQLDNHYVDNYSGDQNFDSPDFVDGQQPMDQQLMECTFHIEIQIPHLRLTYSEVPVSENCAFIATHDLVLERFANIEFRTMPEFEIYNEIIFKVINDPLYKQMENSLHSIGKVCI